jgi:hypothetical protein
VVEHSLQHHNVKGSSPGTNADNVRVKNCKIINGSKLISSSGTVVDYLPHHHKVKVSSPVANVSVNCKNKTDSTLCVAQW